MENTPQLILGEANYKKWVNSVDPNNMLNRQVRRVSCCCCRLLSRASLPRTCAVFSFSLSATQHCRMLVI